MAGEYFKPGDKRRRFQSIPTKTQQRIKNVLGIISGDNMKGLVPRYRKQSLDHLDAYYESRQYNHLLDWDEAAESEEYIGVRKRKPRIIYNLPKALVDRVAAKLVGDEVWPKFVIPDDPETTDLLRVVQKLSGMKSRVVDPIKKMLAAGSSLSRFSIVDGVLQMRSYHSKYVYPEFDAVGELLSARIQYVYPDEKDKDAKGDPKLKWYRLDLTREADILYDNPEFKPDVEPQFQVVETAQHGLGFVQAEWFRTCELEYSPDGYSLYGDILGFCDELNYSLSQSSQAVGYNQEPQVTINSLDSEEVDKLIKSSQKAWNLGREGKAEFLETDLGGVAQAQELRDKMTKNVMDVTRVVMMDPEKILGHAQSGKALEILHGPLVELVSELRPIIEKRLVSLILKMSMAMLHMETEGFDTALVIPEGYAPKSFDIQVMWPPIFPMTMEDLQQKVAVASAAAGASIISRETATRWIAADFGVEDVEAEVAKINSQPVLNPFGSF